METSIAGDINDVLRQGSYWRLTEKTGMESWEAQHRVFTKMMLNWHIHDKYTLPNVCRIQHIQDTFKSSILCTFFRYTGLSCRYMTNLNLPKLSSNRNPTYHHFFLPDSTRLHLLSYSELPPSCLRKLMSHSNVVIFKKIKNSLPLRQARNRAQIIFN